MPKRIAVWSVADSAWMTEADHLCGHSDVFSETWPHSGTTRAGTAFEHPTSAPLTDGSASSSLLQTPSVADAMGGHLSRGGARSGELLLKGQVKELTSSQAPEPATPTEPDATATEAWTCERR